MQIGTLKSKLLAGIVSCLILFNTSGQSQNSLYQNKEDKREIYIDSIETLNILSRDLVFIDSEKSMEYAQTALDLSLKYNFENGEAYAYRNLSNLYTINDIYFLGMDYIQKAMLIFENQNDSSGIADSYISLGHIYRRLHNIDNEIKYFKNAFDIFSRLKIQARTGIAAHNLGETYYNSGDFQQSKKLTLYAIEINKSIQQTSVLSSCYKVLGFLELSENKYLKAEEYFLNALEISKQLGKESQKAATLESMIKLAEMYHVQGKHTEELSLLNEAVEFSKTYNQTSYLPKIYNLMILHYLDDNNHKLAQKYLIEYKFITDSIDSYKLKDKTNLVNQLIYLHSLEKDKRNLEQTEALQKESIIRRNLLLIVTLFFSIILIWVLLKIIHVNNKIKKANQSLINQNDIIKNQNHQLEVLVATKDKLFSIIAHDLRSPFNSILGFSDLLIENLKELSIEQINHHVQLINKNAQSTLDLLDKLLDWARNQTGQINFKPEKLNLNFHIQGVIASLDSSAQLKNITLEYDSFQEMEIYADKNMLTTIVRNLIQNSIKFTQPKGEVKIATSKKQNSVEISISDNGIGMSKEIIDNLFCIGKNDPKLGTINEKGSGLGLLLCKEFVEKHKGKIWIESQEGKGSTFTFIIPQ